MNRKERQRHEFALLVSTGLYHTLDQWTRVLVPFTQWNIDPRPSMDGLLILTAMSSLFALIGTPLVAQMIDVVGLRTSAMIATCMVALYQLLVCHTTNLYFYILIQGLLIFNNMQMIIDAAILNLEGEDGDCKKRTRLITKILIPTSIGYAAGPYCALQMIFFVTPSLELSQSLCAALTILTILPVVWQFFPDNANMNKSMKPDIRGYLDLMHNEKTRWCTILLMIVSGPYAAYDSLIRVSLSSEAIRDPQTMHNLFLIIGLTTMVVNAIFLPKLQELFSPQTLLTGSFGVLTVSYAYLCFFHDYTNLLVGMPIQIIGVTICIGEISSQLMGTIGKNGAGKAAALLRMSQLSAGLFVPFITGAYFSHTDSRMLCVFSSVMSAIAIVVIRQYGSFMKFNLACLPGVLGKVE